MKNQKGITLVALIITIIVMLILAGVSISLVVGDSGVLTQAQKAGDKTNEAEARQAVSLAYADLLMQYYSSTATKNSEKVADAYTTEKLEAAIKANGGVEVTVADANVAEGSSTITVDGVTVSVTLEKSDNGVLKATSIEAVSIADTSAK